MNPLHDPLITYLRAVIGDRIHRARTADRGLGVSAIEWAIITGMLAVIAIAIYATIRGRISDAANRIDTGY
ncbi:hypothetical protein SAMN04489712_12719 [Thermomonospora echinospora]|uniref:Uncharacterized protein n=1 Tax=Thermomonospora echinospora TaxID=1992 RepID=A0A1H6DZG9_9ACTN|nr:hypothetical protein [Thermomonospora echinospora]SEG90722.1 hypothetical protein SAMN04489712_12719 [Thermomonospora echinospora]